MRPGLTDRRQRVERRLFDVHARLDRARAELALFDEQLATTREVADELRIRMLVAETVLANREWDEARRHVEVLEKNRQAAASTVTELERSQDELLSQLLL